MSKTTPETPHYRIALNITDAAIAAGVSRPTIYRWINDGLPNYKIGGVRLIRVTDLDLWISSHGVEA